jgi:hypothetical protein
MEIYMYMAEQLVHDISYLEDKTAAIHLRKYKSPDCDQILAELRQYITYS